MIWIALVLFVPEALPAYSIAFGLVFVAMDGVRC
jgi:hypothetical protein